VFDAQRVSEGVSKYGTAELRLGGAYSIGDVILVGAAEWGQSIHGTLPASDLFLLGGPRRLSGFAPGQIRGDNYKYVRAEAQYKLTKPIPLLGLSMLAGLQAEAGRMGVSPNEPELTGWQSSYGVYLAANSVFGPIYLGYAHGRHAKGRFYFFVGTP